MHCPRSLPGRSAQILTGSLAIFFMSGFASAGPPLAAQQQTEAARVASKVERARERRQAKEEVEARRHFQKEISRYEALHDRLIAKMSHEGTVTASEFASALSRARADAKPGDLLIKEIQPLFKRLIAEQLMGPDSQSARKAVAEGNPGGPETPLGEDDPVKVVVRVNAPYPTGAAHSTVPSSLLLVLPVLPEWLHYRFVGRDLILVDSVAQLIVDFLPAAMPANRTVR